MTIKIKKGLDIKLVGEAEKTVVDLKADKYAVKPTDFIGVFPKLLVKEGDSVKVKVIGFDDRGKVKLSMKRVDQKTGEDLEVASNE